MQLDTSSNSQRLRIPLVIGVDDNILATYYDYHSSLPDESGPAKVRRGTSTLPAAVSTSIQPPKAKFPIASSSHQPVAATSRHVISSNYHPLAEVQQRVVDVQDEEPEEPVQPPRKRVRGNLAAPSYQHFSTRQPPLSRRQVQVRNVRPDPVPEVDEYPMDVEMEPYHHTRQERGFPEDVYREEWDDQDSPESSRGRPVSDSSHAPEYFRGSYQPSHSFRAFNQEYESFRDFNPHSQSESSRYRNVQQPFRDSTRTFSNTGRTYRDRPPFYPNAQHQPSRPGRRSQPQQFSASQQSSSHPRPPNSSSGMSTTSSRYWDASRRPY